MLAAASRRLSARLKGSRWQSIADSRAAVYTGAMSQNGTFVTASGAPGNWRIVVMSVNANGNLNLRVQRGT